MSNYGAATLSIISIRKQPSQKSELLSELLFGETYEILKEDAGWKYIKTGFDQYEGYITGKTHYPVSEEEFTRLNSPDFFITTAIMSILIDQTNNRPLFLVPGSSLPLKAKEDKEFKIGEKKFLIKKCHSRPYNKQNTSFIIRQALLYVNCPYLWGGRTPFGMDCSGFTQLVYKIAGFALPRDASVQSKAGDPIIAIEILKPGDLMFFGEESIKISHVGIYLGDNKIVHASGKVRIDNVDRKGILNVDTNLYSHHYAHSIRIINE